MCPKGGKRSQMESVRLKINENMLSVGEEILCFLDKPLGVTVNVRVFVLERLSAVGESIFNLFQIEMETLETLLEKRNEQLDGMPEHRADILHRPVCKEEVSFEEERSSSPVQEQPEPPHIKDVQDKILQIPEVVAVKSELDGDGENRDTEPVAGTSTEHTKTQAYIEHWVRSQPASDEQLLSTHCSRSEHSDEWRPSVDQSPLNTPKSHKTQHVEGQTLPFSNQMPQNLRPSTETHPNTGEGTFCCRVCRKMFNLDVNLRRHMKTHTHEKSFICQVCGQGFSLKSYLKRHMMIHTGEKRRLCPVCNKGFGDSGNLKRHMRTHTRENPVSCEVCNKGCRDNGELKRHMMTHTDVKPFTCTVCNGSFRERRNLTRHMKKTHPTWEIL